MISAIDMSIRSKAALADVGLETGMAILAWSMAWQRGGLVLVGRAFAEHKKV